MANLKASKEKEQKLLASCIIPHGVETHWNYMYKMLHLAYTYCNAYNEITANCGISTCNYELLKEEWKIVKDLADVLKVCGQNNSLFGF